MYVLMKKLHAKYACQEFLDIIPLMEKHCGYGEHQIPQVQHISAFLKERTGFTLRPVAGESSPRAVPLWKLMQIPRPAVISRLPQWIGVPYLFLDTVYSSPLETAVHSRAGSVSLSSMISPAPHAGV